MLFSQGVNFCSWQRHSQEWGTIHAVQFYANDEESNEGIDFHASACPHTVASVIVACHFYGTLSHQRG